MAAVRSLLPECMLRDRVAIARQMQRRGRREERTGGEGMLGGLTTGRRIC